mmetsp:Transcript_58385/g.170739  ORF Transcript_58385/g.170739 Transcript_58385/m.170739 type:complete len:121 (+) Transcript_58385:1432-1794(+)
MRNGLRRALMLGRAALPCDANRSLAFACPAVRAEECVWAQGLQRAVSLSSGRRPVSQEKSRLQGFAHASALEIGFAWREYVVNVLLESGLGDSRANDQRSARDLAHAGADKRIGFQGGRA